MPFDFKISDVSKIIKQVSKDEILPMFENLSEGDIKEKGPGDLVTVADEASEKALSKALSAILPGSVILGEEAVAKDKNVLKLLDGDAPVWVIDPIDGTYNFANGRRHFGVLLALVQNNEILYGWGYDVPGDRMFYAQKGEGAYLEKNGKVEKISINAAPIVAEMDGLFGGAQPWHFKDVTPLVKSFSSIRCSLHDYIMLLTNKVDFIMHRNSTPWDHSAVVLLAQEAGGYVRMFNEKEYRPANFFGPSLLVATSDQKRWDELKEKIYPVVMEDSFVKVFMEENA